ncbi:MAG: acyl-CoA thioesterase [Endomicrobium sp.]|nr:acyl-CoA thioesterase [Endomicrobium sp.]
MNSIDIGVSYADTYQMGMVYYANYLTFFERDRTELLRSIGLEYKTTEERGVYLPVLHAECKYISPAKYEVKCDEKLLVTGKTKRPFVNKMLKSVHLPKDIKELMEKNLEE